MNTTQKNVEKTKLNHEVPSASQSFFAVVIHKFLTVFFLKKLQNERTCQKEGNHDEQNED
jgi:hypothetical protein